MLGFPHCCSDQAFDDAIAELDTLNEDSYKDSTLIMQVKPASSSICKSPISSFHCRALLHWTVGHASFEKASDAAPEIDRDACYHLLTHVRSRPLDESHA